ncbi:methyltransferase CmcJ [Paraphoma chrysanthemicola]|nr:methyltransferase CmcJ [Paraphoma chrysanthemicola]
MIVHEATRFQYMKWDEKFAREKPYQIISGLSKSSPISNTNINFEQSASEEKVTDIRECPEAYSLDVNGFNVHTICSDFTEWTNRARVETEFIPNIVEPLLREQVGERSRIVVFDWHLRRNVRHDRGKGVDTNDSTQPLPVAKVVHIDQPPAEVVRRVQRHLGDEADQLLQGRVRMINFWKPLYRPVQDAPLAICDASTVQSDDLVAIDNVRRTWSGETVFVLPSPRYKWYYISEQRPDEVLIFKTFDSKYECTARACPHASFTPSRRARDAKPRESIEFRAFIFSDV